MSSKLQSTGPKAKDHQPSAQENLPAPKANAEAIHFLSNLKQEELQMLLFSETLAMVSDTGEPQGELIIEVQTGNYTDESGVMSHCLLVHAFSRSFMDKMLCGNSLLGYLSWNLHIMEQCSQEFIKFRVLPMERKMSLVKQDDQLAVTRRVKEGEEVKTEVTFVPESSTVGFISEAANLVLLRVMAWRQTVPSSARFLALDTEGKFCYSTYQDLGFQKIQVGRQQVEVFIVEQTVHSVKGIPNSCQFYLLSDGHLAKRIQMRLSLAPHLRRGPWCGRRIWNSTRGSWTGRRSSVSATPAICGSTPRPRRSSRISCSSCCCASRQTWSPSPPSTSAPSRSASPQSPPCAPPTGPAPSARWTPSARRTRVGPARRAGTGQEAGNQRDSPPRRAFRAAGSLGNKWAPPPRFCCGRGNLPWPESCVLAKKRNC
uniref:Ciliogenesis-associated TTC17-interacting protein n=1 Tax=Callorhinus ursinus TaxID=34884 RepID=A0A3Q7QP05_CALUR|nr:ciliogenesis-associated TTC17-interacting protein isoform X2 [Callorhinus ursinus]